MIVEQTIVEEPIAIPVQLKKHAIDVRHVPINEIVECMPTTREVGDVTIIPVVREVPVVFKKLMLVEEIHITKSSNTEPKLSRTVSENIRSILIEPHSL